MIQKIYIFIVILFCFSCNSKSQKSKTLSNDIISTISFKEDLYDFGTIPAKKEAIAIFKFSNTGNNPLIITEVKTSCGCTVPEYTKEPLEPNEKGEIKVV